MTRKDIRKLDKEFSLYIRSRGACEHCGSKNFLQTSHIYSRRYLSIRWHPLNAFCFCAKSHLWWHHRPADGVEWAKAKLGDAKWTILKRLSLEIGVTKKLSPSEVRKWWS